MTAQDNTAAAETEFQRGLALARSGGGAAVVPQVVEHFREALRLDPEGHWHVAGHLAYMLYNNGRFDEAADLYRRICERAPADSEAEFFHAMAEARAEGGFEATQRVIRRFRDALRRDPEGYRPILGHLAYLLYNNNRYDEAAALYARLLERTPDDREAVYFLAQALVRAGKRREAKPWLWRCARMWAGTRRGWTALAQITPLYMPLRPWMRDVYRNAVLAFTAPLVAASVLRKRKRRFALLRYMFWSWRHWTDSLKYLSYSRSAEYPFAYDVLNAPRGSTVLDIGTGNAPFVGFAVEQGLRIVGCDPDRCIRELHQRLPHLRGSRDLLLMQASGDRLPFADNSFNRVLSVSTVEHIPYDGDLAVMREIARVLQPGGRAVVTTEGFNEPVSDWMLMPFHVGYQYDLGAPIDDEFASEHSSLGFYRCYDEADLIRRLGTVDGLRLVEAGFLVDRFQLRRFFPDYPDTVFGKLIAPWKTLLGHWAMKRTACPLPTRTNLWGAVGYVVLEKD